jgi:hypothetical protein
VPRMRRPALPDVVCVAWRNLQMATDHRGSRVKREAASSCRRRPLRSTMLVDRTMTRLAAGKLRVLVVDAICFNDSGSSRKALRNLASIRSLFNRQKRILPRPLEKHICRRLASARFSNVNRISRRDSSDIRKQRFRWKDQRTCSENACSGGFRLLQMRVPVARAFT